MNRKSHIIILLLLARFAFCSNCDCKLVEILRNIVQKEIMEREILESRVDMLESKFASGNINDVSTSESSSDKTILERLSVIETMIEKFNTIIKENSIERQNGARHNAALTNAWKIHKRDFTLMKEDIHNSLIDNKKSVYDVIREADERMEVVEVKVEQLISQTSSKVTKQLNTAEDRFEMIQSRLNLTFENYTTRMNNDFSEFKHNTDQRLYDFHTDILTDECAGNPCLHGATCIAGIKSYLCICITGFTGTNCHELDECASNPCVNNATCVDGINKYSCKCMPGYNGANCQIELDECSSNPCVNNGTCVDGSNRYSCSCLPGYYGTNCQIEIDECASMPCANKGTCVDGINRYSCRCLPGYNGTNCQFECKYPSSSLYCNCVDECPGAIDEAICECENGYSNEFVTIPGKIISGLNILNQIVSSAVECQKLCINTEGCLSCELEKTYNRCWINHESPITQPSAYDDHLDYDFFARKCLC